MAGARTVTVNHVGQCVSDLDRARRFYEAVFGFREALRLEIPDAAAASLLRLPLPLGMTALYLERDGFVLELLHFADAPQVAAERAMNQPGLTHVSFGVEDLGAAVDAVRAHGGEVLDDTHVGVAVFARDPDGQLFELLTGWTKPTGPPT